jgi:hypothetical protein
MVQRLTPVSFIRPSAGRGQPKGKGLIVRTVYKYNFQIHDEFTLETHESFHVVLAGLQNGTPTLWAIVDTESPIVQHKFFVEGTGHPIAPKSFHVGSFQQGSFVWHVFQEHKEDEIPRIHPDSRGMTRF